MPDEPCWERDPEEVAGSSLRNWGKLLVGRSDWSGDFVGKCTPGAHVV